PCSAHHPLRSARCHLLVRRAHPEHHRSLTALALSCAQTHRTVRPRTPFETASLDFFIIFLDTYILFRVYKKSGIRIRNHCRAEPPRDIEPPGLVATVGGRDRASASYAAADRFQAPESAARCRFRGIDGGCTAPCVPAEA